MRFMVFIGLLMAYLPTIFASSSCPNLFRLISDQKEFHSKNFSNWLNAKQYTLLDGAPLESTAFVRRGVALEGGFNPKVVKSLEENQVLVRPMGGVKRFGGQDYIEFPNSTAMQTVDSATGKERFFIMTRGVRPYETKVDVFTGGMQPQNYVSDVLLFEEKGGQYEFIHTILKSEPEANFRFEDPRISFVIDEKGNKRFFLSGTDYSPHRSNADSPDIMNRYLEIELDDHGVPRVIDINSKNKETLFQNMSPFPQKNGEDYLFVDAKNATIFKNEYDEIVVRTRMRPDFDASSVKSLAGDDHWKYAEQVFIFKNFDEFQKYNWKYALEDLFKPDLSSKRIKPVHSEVLLRDHQLKELYQSAKIIPEKGKGFGPGSIPVRVRRSGGEVYLSDGKGAKEFMIGSVAKDDTNFIIAEGEVKYLSFDHEIRYFADLQNESSFVKRHYSATVKMFDDRLSKIEAYFADVIQPITTHELGFNSGIVDLQHVYPMGRVIISENDSALVRIYAGASDAHTTVYDFDMMKLLKEMSPVSPRRGTGQVYLPE